MMSIPHISTDRPIRTPEAKLVLRDGQIVHGKVNKIYPNNRAEIQIGSARVTAEIIAPLEIGKNYLFQVQQKGAQLVHLKVLGEQFPNRVAQNVTALLEQLNIKLSRHHLQFAQMLIDGKIPFQRQQLVDALQLLSQVGFNKQNIELVLNMIANNKPITNNFFQAMLSIRNNSVSDVLLTAKNALLQNSSQSPITAQAARIIEQLLNSPANIRSNIPTNIQHSLTETLQLLNYISREASSQNVLTGQNAANQNMQSIYSQLVNLTKSDSIRHDFLQIVRHSQSLTHLSSELLQRFPGLQTGNLSEANFNQLKQQIEANLLPTLPASAQNVIQSILNSNNSENQQTINHLLQALRSNEFYTLLLEAANNHIDKNTINTSEPIVQARFLHQIQQFIQQSGITNESSFNTLLLQSSEIIQELLTANPSLKSLVLQAMQDDNIPAERLQQLIHFLNGMQLQAKETNNMMQVYLQIPGEKLNTLKDISLEFTGRKTKDGKIDPNFCRILFVLNLENIKETIIDMHVQKRVVSLTIYNENSDTLNRMMQPLKEVLKKQLDALNFHLSNVRLRPMHEEEHKVEKQETKQVERKDNQERFDFLI